MLSLLVIAAVIGLILVIASFQKKIQGLRQVSQGLLVSYITILLLLSIGEAYFHFVYAESTSFTSLSHENWKARYIQRNSQGYRDREWLPSDLEGREVVVTIGDSFTEGHGINNPEDRWSNVLGSLLGDDYAVVNLGISGSATRQQLEAVQNFDLATPNVIIWQYFLNDIEFAAQQNGEVPPITPPPTIVQESYLLNFLYFRTVHLEFDYFAWLHTQYDNATIWEFHRQELEDMVAYADSINAELIVLIYPNMLDPMGSIPYVDRVAQALEASGETNILKLFDAVAAWPVGTPIVVSTMDAHPSVAFNRYVAETLYNLYFVNP
jgi:lysophospholipase L1-like esterase